LRIPKLCHHRRSGQWYVTDPNTKREVYFGIDRMAAQTAYGEWVRNFTQGGSAVDHGLTMAELIGRYLDHCAIYYRNTAGRATSEINAIRASIEPIIASWPEEPASGANRAWLKSVREGWVEADLSRKTINSYVSRIRRMFRWAAVEDLIPAGIVADLAILPNLPKGRSNAKELPPVAPVAWSDVVATMRHLPISYRLMIQIQWHTGCRPGELVNMRLSELDRTSKPWVFRPSAHKGSHRGRHREIVIGPRARRILSGLLVGLEGDDPIWPHLSGSGPMTVNGLGKAIRLANREHGLTPWTPHQIRHSALTRFRRLADLDTARAIGGHSEHLTTEIYAEQDLGRAKAFLEQHG
jgi:integrase